MFAIFPVVTTQKTMPPRGRPSYDVTVRRWKSWARSQQKRYNNNDAVPVKLVPIPGKAGQLGVVAKRDLRKGTTFAVYVVEAIKDGSYQSPLGDTYNIGITNARGQVSPDKIGMITLPCLADDLYEGVPRWGAFLNEPSPGETVNTNVQFGLLKTFVPPSRMQPTTLQLARMKTSRAVKQGEELVWCYGPDYPRTYDTPCATAAAVAAAAAAAAAVVAATAAGASPKKSSKTKESKQRR